MSTDPILADAVLRVLMTGFGLAFLAGTIEAWRGERP